MYGYQYKQGGDFIFRVGGSQDIQEVDRVLDIIGEHHAIYMFCCEQLDSIHGGIEVGGLYRNESCS
jgi:hypothetical protein